MRVDEILTEEQLNELNWRKGLATAALGAAALGSMGSAHARPEVGSQNAMSIPQPAMVQQQRIDYTKPGPITQDSMGQKLEYGIPINAQGNFIAPNQDLPDQEFLTQLKSYKTWKADFLQRWPSAKQKADGTMSTGGGLAPMKAPVPQ